MRKYQNYECRRHIYLSSKHLRLNVIPVRNNVYNFSESLVVCKPFVGMALVASPPRR